MFKFKVNGKEYDFKYSNLIFDVGSQDFDADDVEVTCDGKEKDNYFGVSFGGYSYTVYDALCAAIVAYVNNDTSYDFIEVPDDIKKIRSGFFKKQLTTNGRDIPKQILTPELEVCDVKMITKDGEAAYLGKEATILTYPDGSVATDMENFFMEGVLDLYQDSEIVFIDPEFEDAIKENIEESSNITNMVDKILEGADIRTTLTELSSKKPLIELSWLIKHFEDEAKKAGYETATYAKNTRKCYVKCVYNALVGVDLRPQGFWKDHYQDTLRGYLSSFYAHELRVDEFCPPEWRESVVKYLVDSLTKNEQAWIDSRYEFINSNGKTYIRAFW